jgi:hypothetical protein
MRVATVSVKDVIFQSFYTRGIHMSFSGWALPSGIKPTFIMIVMARLKPGPLQKPFLVG